MAKLSYKGRVVEVDDTDRLLLDYYRGDGATVIDEPQESPELGDAAGEPQLDGTADPAAATDTAGTAEGDSAPQPGDTPDPASA